MFAYASDPEVTRHVSWGTHRSAEDSSNFLRFVVEGYRKKDFGGWGVAFKESGEFVGTCGLYPSSCATGEGRAELGYALSREHWGGGSCPRPCGR